MAETPHVLIDNLVFPEGPRWHEGRLWFSDMHDHRVVVVGDDGKPETVVEVAGQPSGLGWLPDGTLLIVSMTDRRLLRLDGDELAAGLPFGHAGVDQVPDDPGVTEEDIGGAEREAGLVAV